MKRKRFITIVAVVVVMAMLISGCGKSNAAHGKNDAKATTVRFGIDSSILSVAFQIADHNGYFKKYGINAKINTIGSGIDTLNAALTNQVDVGVASDFAALSRLKAGKLRIISFLQSGNPKDNKFVTVDGITDIKDLKGQAVGVPRGTAGEYVTYLYLKKHGISENDLQVDKFSSAAELLAALGKGDVKGAFFRGAVLEKALNVKGAKVVGDQGEINYSGRNFVVVTSDLIKRQPQVSKKILQSLNDATNWIKLHPDKAADIVATKLKLPKDGVKTELKDQLNDIRLNNKDVQQLQDLYQYGVSTKLFSGRYNLKAYIDTKPLKDAFPSKLTYHPSEVK
ncbi:MAG: ABC transporter substrate-binding protein [Sporolactobacillus sp.]|jgi:NitT/TauT family transport system substrate-binding protein|nr:ABC transporter substrate-binding protein [Sporolactobacillus sp.]